MRYKDFFNYINEREHIRQKKERGDPWPWTDDLILQKYKFTNVRREDDKTTRWMREHWTGPNLWRPLELQLFNCAVFRYFGTIEFAREIGWCSSWKPARIVKISHERMKRGQKVFTGAYLITNGGRDSSKVEVVCDYLSGFKKRCHKLVKIAEETSSWRAVCSELVMVPGYSWFMAKEVLQDAMRTPVLNTATDRNTWCPAGPGALRGIARLAHGAATPKPTQSEALETMLDLFEIRNKFLEPHVPELELHDIQFCLCEFDKYERTRLGEGRPRSLYAPVLRK